MPSAWAAACASASAPADFAASHAASPRFSVPSRLHSLRCPPATHAACEHCLDLGAVLDEAAAHFGVAELACHHQGSSPQVRCPIRIGPVFQQDFDHGGVALLAGEVEGGGIFVVCLINAHAVGGCQDLHDVKVALFACNHHGSSPLVRCPIRIGPVFQQDCDHGGVALIAGSVEGGASYNVHAVDLDGL